MKIIPRIDNTAKLSAAIKIGLSTNLGEIQGVEDVFSKDNLKNLKEQQEKIIENEVLQVIQYAQKEGLDFFGAAFQYNYRYPRLWDRYESNWSEYFRKIKFSVNVESKINRSYTLTEPTLSKVEQ